MKSGSRRAKFPIAVLATLAAFAAAFTGVVYLPILPADAPTALVSVDRSFWNRVGMNRLTHVRALRNAGIRPVVIDFGTRAATSAAAEDLLDGFDALVLGGGGDVDSSIYGTGADPSQDVSPARDTFELALLAAAEKAGIPVLGLCRGAQLINVHRGGTLGDFRADSPRYDRHHRLFSGHPVELDANSRLATIYGATRLHDVVTFHGQHVARPGRGVRIVAHAPDGTPEAIEVETTSSFGMLGVQWHAEAAPWDSDQSRLFLALAEAASAHRGRRTH